MLKLKLADYSTPILAVYLVDGQYIRDNIYLDFTEGGNYLRYAYIPQNEIWLGGIHIIECKFVLIHELAEVLYAIDNDLDLRQDSDYTVAHNYANECEQACRNAPNTVDDTLSELLSKFTEIPQKGEEKILWKILPVKS